MTSKRATLEDGSILAENVRALALEAHRVLSNPSAGNAVDVQALLQRLARVRRHVQETEARDLGRWLDNLHGQLERALRLEAAKARV